MMHRLLKARTIAGEWERGRGETERQRDRDHFCNADFGLGGHGRWEAGQEQARALGVSQGSACCSQSLHLAIGNKGGRPCCLGELLLKASFQCDSQNTER